MTLKRQELEEYVVYAERLSADLDAAIADLEFRAKGGRVHLAIDFSEIHSFLVPDQLDDSWLWPGLDESMKSVVEHSALSEVLTGPPKPILLPPYLLEFQSFVTNLRFGIADKMMSLVPEALQNLNELTQLPEAKSLLDLAASLGNRERGLTHDELEKAVQFFETHARDLVSLVRGEVLEPLARTQAFLQTKPFGSLDEVFPIQLSGRETEVANRFQRLQRLRGGGREGANYVDSLALEYVRRANQGLAQKGASAVVLLISRSNKVRALLEEETRAGLWPKTAHGFIRHPRGFAPLAWHLRRAREDAVPQLTATKESLDLCRRSAGLRLKGTWTELPGGRGDSALSDMVTDIKCRIMKLVQMGGGVNESRILKPTHDEHEVLRLLAMLRNRAELLEAVADRMADINTLIDREHEAVGVLLHTESVSDEIAIHSASRTERLVLPRLGRLPYALHLRTPALLKWLDELRQKGEITHENLLRLFVRTTKETADHYESLLFMAHTLALVGLYPLADEYCIRALQSAERSGSSDSGEAQFLHAVCGRVVARDPGRLAEVQRMLKRLKAGAAAPDARYLTEEGNVKLKWWVRSLEDNGPKWKKDAPTGEEVITALQAAETAAEQDKRLLASVRNSLCYAQTYLYRNKPTPNQLHRANAALDKLIFTLKSIEPESEHWPIRIKDTIVNAALTLPHTSLKREFIEELIDGMEKSLKDGSELNDPESLMRKIKQYRKDLATRTRPRSARRG